MKRSPFPYYGGKQILAPRIAALMPPHSVYVEAFGGGGSVLFCKPASALEVYNDLDSGLVTFFRVLRDREQCAELERLLSLTPHSREEWDACRRNWQNTPDDIERARRWYTALAQSFSKSAVFQHGWSHNVTASNHSAARSWRARIEALPAFHARFRSVQVEHLPALDVIAKYDGPETLFYLDPPYLHTTRAKSNTAEYTTEMSASDHAALLEAIQRLRGGVILSGYASPLYDDALAAWGRIEAEARNWAANSRASEGKRSARREVIWLSPNLRARSLWEVGA